MRVPNKGWDETPRRGNVGSVSSTPRRSWDETPRNGNGRNRDGDSPETVNGKEWEEEQVRLDRDWYTYDDEGQVVCELPAALTPSPLPNEPADQSRLVMKSTIPFRNGRTSRGRRRRKCSKKRKSVKQLARRNT